MKREARVGDPSRIGSPTRVEVSSSGASNRPWRKRPDPCRHSCPRASCHPAALALAIVLSLAGVLGQVLLIGCYRYTDKCGRTGGRFRVPGNRLGVETGSGTAKKAGESRGQHEVVYIVARHEEFLSSVGHRALCIGY